MALTLASAADLLKEHHLLREIIQGDVWTDDPARIASADEPFAGITYDTRKVTPGTLLCCKGQFKAEYLNGIDEAGLAAYVAETEYSAATATPGLIVMSIADIGAYFVLSHGSVPASRPMTTSCHGRTPGVVRSANTTASATTSAAGISG